MASGALSSAVQWWEEAQLRVPVLGSMALQLILFVAAPLRKLAIPAPFMFFIWLSYLGSDALAIYALATLFNRHGWKRQPDDGGSSSVLEVLWAPVLLMHLGGQTAIAAYNIEDNELWEWHVVTAVTQVAVAVYIFCKSWPPGGDKLLLTTAVLCFFRGTLKCFIKAVVLQRASVNGLGSSFAPRRVSTGRRGAEDLEESLVRFVQLARATSGNAIADQSSRPAPDGDHDFSNAVRRRVRREPRKLILDLLSPYSDRLSLLKQFRVLGDSKAYDTVRIGLSITFDILYTPRRLELVEDQLGISGDERRTSQHTESLFRIDRSLRFMHVVLVPLTALGLFHKSHKEGYRDDDVKVTYTLLCCTIVLELFSYVSALLQDLFASKPKLQGLFRWPEDVAKYSLIRFFINKHSKWAWLLLEPLANAVLLVIPISYIDPFLQPLFGMESCRPRRPAASPAWFLNTWRMGGGSSCNLQEVQRPVGAADS